MNESQTRKEIIDIELKKRHWDIKNKSDVVEEYHMEKKWGMSADGNEGLKNEFADYILLDEDGQTPLSIVEAKRTSKNARVGQRQAEGYAENIRKQIGFEPFIFLTNGETILFWDKLRYPPRKTYGFFERRDLKRLQYIRSQLVEKLSFTKTNASIVNRPYQIEAVKRIAQNLEKGHRKCLLVMATGTGKTRTAMALIDVMIRSKWASNILFLTDRKILRDQAYGKKGFQGFFTEAMGKIKTAEFDQTKRLYSSTIQTMMEIYKKISPGFFDLIIMDECHRSIYNKWQDILIYFDAIQVGLTATPSDSIDRDTLRFFDCNDGKPTFNYSYDEALEDKILVPFTPYHAKTSFQIKGLKSEEIPPEIKEKLLAEGKTEEELSFEGTEFEKRFTNKASLEAMVKEFMDVSIKDETGTLPGKSIYFAISKDHAYRILETFDRLYPEYKGRLAEVIVSDDSRSDDFMGRFENDSFPRVAISVDMLDTGVDVREAVNLIFAKPIFSKIKFWQMIGRGTRILDPENLKTWCPEKDRFLIIDHWSNFEYFNLKPEGEIANPQDSLPTKLFKLRVQKLKLLMSDKKNPLFLRTKDEIIKSLKALPEDSISIRENKAVIQRVVSDEFWKYLDTDYLTKIVAPLLRFTENVNFDVLSFLMKCEKLDICLLTKAETEMENLGESIRANLYALPPSLNVIKRKEREILKAGSEEFWSSVTHEDIFFLKEEIAPLMKYKEVRRDIIEFDLSDSIVERLWIEFGPAGEGEYVAVYREKVVKHIQKLADQNEVLKKLKQDVPVTDEDLDRLEETLNSPELYITEKNLREVFQEPQGNFKQFILQILGKFRFPSREERIAEHFDTFIHRKEYLEADQVRFLRIVKNVFIEKSKRNQKLTINDLYEGSFEVLGADAADRLFKKEELKEIVEFFSLEALEK